MILQTHCLRLTGGHSAMRIHCCLLILGIKFMKCKRISMTARSSLNLGHRRLKQHISSQLLPLTSHYNESFPAQGPIPLEVKKTTGKFYCIYHNMEYLNAVYQQTKVNRLEKQFSHYSDTYILLMWISYLYI